VRAYVCERVCMRVCLCLLLCLRLCCNHCRRHCGGAAVNRPDTLHRMGCVAVCCNTLSLCISIHRAHELLPNQKKGPDTLRRMGCVAVCCITYICSCTIERERERESELYTNNSQHVIHEYMKKSRTHTYEAVHQVRDLFRVPILFKVTL